MSNGSSNHKVLDVSDAFLLGFTAESNRIEGIHRKPTDAEIAMLRKFLGLRSLTVGALEDFVRVYQPGAKLRRHAGMDVRVGQHFPPGGGPQVEKDLILLLDQINGGILGIYEGHMRYETLHPFMDGNGRSGRAVWLWQMKGNAPLGFLHHWYYQSLQAAR